MALELILLSLYLGPTLNLLLGAFGTPWGPKGLSLGSLLLPFGCIWTPWDHLGHLGLPSGAWDDLVSKMDVQFRANGSQVRNLRTKSDLAELSRGSRGSELSPQSGARAAAPNPTSLSLLPSPFSLGMLVSPFGCLWNSFCGPWGDFEVPFGSLWGALGSQCLLGVTLASLWLPWDAVGPFGAPWVPKRSLG